MAGFFKKAARIFSPAAALFGMNKNPANAARPYQEQVPGYGREAYDPFIAQGREAYSQLSPEYLRFLKEPHQTYAEDVKQYEPSAYYQRILPEIERYMHDAAMQGGNLGTETDMRNRGDLIRDVMGQDISNYIAEINSRRGIGITGLEQATGRGFQGAGSLADYLGNAAQNRAQLEFAGQEHQNLNKMGLVNALMKALATGYGGNVGAAATAGGAGGGMDANTPQRTGVNLNAINTRLPRSRGPIRSSDYYR